MMKKMLLSGSTLAFAIFAAGPASAQAVNPGGPFVTPDQEIQLNAFTSNAKLAETLADIERRSKGVVEVESITTTATGEDVWLVKIGDPSNDSVLIITQQHGDEPHGTEAALEIIKKLATNSAEARRILDELYVLIVPRVNPSGFIFPDRGNGDLSAPPADTRTCLDADGNVIASRLNQGRGVYTDRFVGDPSLWHYDINRYHWPDWSQSDQIVCNPDFTGIHFDPTTHPVPEAAAIIDAFFEFNPLWVIDVHNQGFNVIDDEDAVEDGVNRANRQVTSSILWPTNPDAPDAAVDFSKQIAIAIKERSLELGYAETTRYSGGTFPGIARNAYGLLGAGSVLIEIKGQIEGSLFSQIGQKQIGMLNNVAREFLLTVLERTADGSIYTLDPDDAEFLIRDSDTFLPNPHVEE